MLLIPDATGERVDVTQDLRILRVFGYKKCVVYTEIIQTERHQTWEIEAMIYHATGLDDLDHHVVEAWHPSVDFNFLIAFEDEFTRIALSAHVMNDAEIWSSRKN